MVDIHDSSPEEEAKISADYPPIDESLVKPCPSRFRNSLAVYKVARTSACTKCGKCAEVCKYGVHVKAGNRMLAPKSHLCRGSEVCRTAGTFCVNECPEKAIKVGPDPMWGAFGDPRWTSELLTSTWQQAATGMPSDRDMEYKKGASRGGFDRINIVFQDHLERTYAQVAIVVSNSNCYYSIFGNHCAGSW